MSVAEEVRKLSVKAAGRLASKGITDARRTVMLSPAEFIDLINEVGAVALRDAGGLYFEGNYIEIDSDNYSGPYLVIQQVIHL